MAWTDGSARQGRAQQKDRRRGMVAFIVRTADTRRRARQARGDQVQECLGTGFTSAPKVWDQKGRKEA